MTRRRVTSRMDVDREGFYYEATLEAECEVYPARVGGPPEVCVPEETEVLSETIAATPGNGGPPIELTNAEIDALWNKARWEDA